MPKEVFKYEGKKGGNITRREAFTGTFEQFQKQNENTHVFKKLEEKERLSELKKAFKALTEKEETQAVPAK